MNSDLCKYFRNSNLSYIVLCGPKAEVQCKLLIRAKSVKIGNGWKKFCELHGLEERDLHFLRLTVKKQTRMWMCCLIYMNIIITTEIIHEQYYFNRLVICTFLYELLWTFIIYIYIYVCVCVCVCVYCVCVCLSIGKSNFWNLI